MLQSITEQLNPIPFLNNIADKCGLTLKQLLLRFLSGAVFISWLSFLPTYMILHYMIHNHFYSYDMFSLGESGILSFGLVSAFLLLFLSLTLYGFIPLMKACWLKKKKKAAKFSDYFIVGLFFSVALLVHLSLFLGWMEKDKLEVYAVFSSLGLVICLYITFSFIGKTFKREILNPWPPTVFILFTFALPLSVSEANNHIVTLGLKMFRIGGMVNVSVQTNKDAQAELLNGKLILQTPKNLYVENEKGGLVTIPYSSVLILKTGELI